MSEQHDGPGTFWDDLLADPEELERLGQLSRPGSDGVENSPITVKSLAQLFGSLSAAFHGDGKSSGGTGGKDRKARHSSAERNALLAALKPYVNPERRALIDALIRIGTLADFLTDLYPDLKDVLFAPPTSGAPATPGESETSPKSDRESEVRA